MQGITGHAFGMEHALHLVHPNGFATIGILLYFMINRLKCARAMMLRPVKFNTSAYPWASKPNQSWLNNTIVINKMIIVAILREIMYDLIVCKCNEGEKYELYSYF